MFGLAGTDLIKDHFSDGIILNFFFIPTTYLESVVSGMAQVIKWYPVVVKTMFEVTFCST